MTDLSPAAQAVLDAVEDDCIHPTDLHRIAAAALRTAADQVISLVPPTSKHWDVYAQGFRAAHVKYRAELLAIAAELETSTTENR